MKQKYYISLFIVTAMVAWLFSGQFSGSETGDGTDASLLKEDTAKSVPIVRGVFSQAAPHRIELTVRGRTEVNRLVKVRSEIVGRVVELPVEKGARVERGDVLCRMAMDARDKNLVEARAVKNQASLEYKGLQDLAQKGLQSDIAIAQAKSKLESANASVSRALLAMSNTRIRAPFAGLIEEQPVEIGDFLNVGGECSTILDADPILVVGQVAERDIGHVQVGEKVSASLITGEQVEGVISFAGRSADKVTRAYRIEVEVPNPGFSLRAGITSELMVPVGTREAHRISPAALVLDDEGELGVRTVNAGDIVEFYQVEVISEGADGIWITGLPDQVNLITVGHEVVFEGQVVQIDLTPLTSLVSE